MTDTPPAEPVRCRATKSDGTPCGVSWGLVGGLCLSHDPGRRAQAEAARRAGAAATGALFAAQRAQYRSAAPEHLPTRHPPRTLADIIRWASWCAWAQAVGLVD